MTKGWSHHRNGGLDPPELLVSAQPVIHRPTGGRHTRIILPQMVMDAASSNRTSLSYWLIVVALVIVGFLTIFSIGMYFWLIAIALIVMSPFRSKPRIFRSGIALFAGSLIGYVLIAPWGCSQTFESDPTTGEGTVSPVVCTSPVGIEYSGPEPFDPSLTPALIMGGVFAVVASLAAWLMTAKRSDNPTSNRT